MKVTAVIITIFICAWAFLKSSPKFQAWLFLNVFGFKKKGHF